MFRAAWRSLVAAQAAARPVRAGHRPERRVRRRHLHLHRHAEQDVHRPVRADHHRRRRQPRRPTSRDRDFAGEVPTAPGRRCSTTSRRCPVSPRPTARSSPTVSPSSGPTASRSASGGPAVRQQLERRRGADALPARRRRWARRRRARWRSTRSRPRPASSRSVTPSGWSPRPARSRPSWSASSGSAPAATSPVPRSLPSTPRPRRSFCSTARTATPRSTSWPTRGSPSRSWPTRSSAVAGPGVKVQTGEEAADDAASDITEALGFFNIILLAFALIALFVGSFLIFNTFSMLISQRTRELALLRAVGATRGQVIRSVLAESLVVGLVGSVARLPARHRGRLRCSGAFFGSIRARAG